MGLVLFPLGVDQHRGTVVELPTGNHIVSGLPASYRAQLSAATDIIHHSPSSSGCIILLMNASFGAGEPMDTHAKES